MAKSETGTEREDWISLDEAAARLGMSLDGVIRESYLFGGRRHDAEIWSLLVTDPRPWTL